jgi:hypothetical protein
MLDEQLNKLFLKRAFAMMRFLFFDIVGDSGNVRAAHAKRAITGLPGKGLPGFPKSRVPSVTNSSSGFALSLTMKKLAAIQGDRECGQAWR